MYFLLLRDKICRLVIYRKFPIEALGLYNLVLGFGLAYERRGLYPGGGGGGGGGRGGGVISGIIRIKKNVSERAIGVLISISF